mgnify:CR=1 FL=1
MAKYPQFLPRRPLWVVLIYVVVALAVLVAGEAAAVLLVVDPQINLLLDVVKYVVFVAVSALILYWLLHRHLTALSEAEMRYRELVENAGDIVYTLDLDGRFTSISPAVQTLLGYAPAELLGRSLAELAPEAHDHLAAMLAAKLQGEPYTVYELPLTTRAGRPVVLEINSRLLYENDQPVGIHGVARDITVRKQTAAELQAVAEAASTLRTNLTRADMLPRVIAQIVDNIRVDAAALGLYRAPADVIDIELATGVWAAMQGMRVSIHGTLVGSVLQTGQPYVAADVRSDSRATQPDLLVGANALAIVPLLADQQPIGLVGIGRATPFVENEIRLLTAIADIAATALHRAVAYELAQRRAEQLAIVNSLARTLIQTRDLSAIYDQIAATIQQLWGDVALLLISTYDASSGLITCVYGIDDGRPIDPSSLPPLPLGRGPQSEAIRTRQTVITGDLMARLQAATPLITIGDAPFAQSALSAPLLAADDVVGVLQVQSTQRDRYTESDAEMLTLIANTAAAGLQNARLFEAERAQRVLAEALRDTSATINSTLNFDEVLDRMLDNIERVVPHDTANIMLIDPQTRIARVARQRGYDRISPELNMAVAALSFPVEEVANLRQMLHTRQPFIIADTHAYEGWVDVPETRWQRSSLGAPICLRHEVVGFIHLDSHQPNYFSAAQAERLQVFANQAAIAIENARLFEAEREQRALAEVLHDAAAVLTSSLDIDVVLSRVLSIVGQIVPNDLAAILQIEDGTARVVRIFGQLSPAEEASFRSMRFSISATPNLRWLVEEGQALAVGDVRDDPGWIETPDFHWIRSFVAAPIQVGGRVISVLLLYSSLRGFYTPLHADRLRILAAQAAIAIGNAQLFDQSQRRVQELAALFDSSVEITSTLDRAAVLRSVSSRLAAMVDATSAYILEVDWRTGTGTVIAEYFSPVANALERVSDLGSTHKLTDFPQTWESLRAGQPHTTTLSQADADPAAIEDLQKYGGKSTLRVPLMTAGQVRGYAVLWDSRTERQWTETEIRLCQTLANQAAVALENVRLFEETQRRLTEQSALLEASLAVSSSLDLNTVLQRLAEQIGRAIGVTSVYVCEWDQAASTAQVVIDYYSPEASARERVSDLGHIYRIPEDYGLPPEWLDGRSQVVHADDPELSPVRRQHLVDYDGRSVLTVGLIAKSKTFGFIELWESRRRREFSPDEIALCEGIARQAAIAFENARLFEAERKQLKLAQTLQAVGALLTAEMSLDAVFEYLFDLLARVVHFDSVSIQLFEGDRAVLAAGRGFPDLALSQHIVNVVTLETLQERWSQPHRRYIVIPDTHHDPRWVLDLGNQYIHSWIGAALRVKGRLLGILNVDSAEPNAYNEELGETVAAFANQAAIAIENAQLHEAVRRHAEELEARVIDRTIELENERKRTAAVLDTAGEGIMLTDFDGRIEYVNPAMERLTGYTSSEMRGQNPRLWQSGRTSPALYHEMWDRIKRGGIWQGELVNRRKDGTLYDAALTIAPLTDASGVIAGFVGVQRDITHQKELDRLKDEFVSNVSHELRTPIANVKLYLSLLTRGKPEKQTEYLQTLRRETARLEQLIENLLDLSRLDLGTTRLALAPTDLAQLLAPLVADRSALAAAKHLTIDYQAEPGRVMAEVDPTLLIQVASNLLTNAINYTPAGGLVTVTIGWQKRDDRTWAVFTVKNTGPGISAFDRPHLFERFYRGEAGRKSGTPGTGLGLAISKQIIDRLGGQITVESEPGRGAAFTVWLNPAV